MIYFDRQVLKGIKARLDEAHFKVSLHLESGTALNELTQEPWDYVIADYDKNDFRQIVQSCRARVLAAYSNHRRNDFLPQSSTVIIDNQYLANTALRRFIHAGLNYVSFFANAQDADQPWGQERKTAFASLATQSNIDYEVDIFQAIQAQHFPIGVYCSSDRAARKLAQYCQFNHVEVPAQVSIIGTDSDNTERMLSPLPLSSLELNPYELGRFCVDTLIKTIRFKRRLQQLYTPAGLYEAATTRHSDPTDDIVNRAELFIRNNFHLNIKIQQVMDYCHTSRKTLDSRFLQAHGLTAHQFLTRARIRRAKYLLTHSRDKLNSIALQCGYPNQSYLTQVFNKQVGQSPSQYRQNPNDNQPYIRT
jgi:AraC-like DNA-binding protein